MLGDQVSESTGTVTGTRVLAGDDYRYVKLEITVEEEGTVLGMPAQSMATYVAYERVPGQMYAEGTGLLMSEGGTAIWNGHGVGQPTGEGMGISMRFSIAVQADPDSSLAGLNGVLIVGEHETDAEGNTRTSTWEWK